MDARGPTRPGSICEKRFLDVSGTQQGMFLRGRDRGNPVLLTCTTHDMRSDISGIVLPSPASLQYSRLWTFRRTSCTACSTTCSYELARSYVRRLRAPVKGFYTFERSAHSPIFEEPERAGRIMREDALGGVANLDQS